MSILTREISHLSAPTLKCTYIQHIRNVQGFGHTHLCSAHAIHLSCGLDVLTWLLTGSLQNRQRHKIEEQEADIGRLKGEIASLRRDHQRLLAENGRSSDATEELQTHLRSVRGGNEEMRCRYDIQVVRPWPEQ